MTTHLSHKGYIGTVQFSAEDDCFFGRIEGINDLVIFEGTSVAELKAAFIEAVEDYLALCASQGKTPEKAFKGSFNVRVSPEIHRKAFRIAAKSGKSLNQFVQDALEKAVSE